MSMSTPAPNTDALMERWMHDTGRYQMALQVVYELAVYGPGTAAQIAERLTEHDDSGEMGPVQAQWVDEAFAELDLWSLLDYAGLEEVDPVSLVGRHS